MTKILKTEKDANGYSVQLDFGGGMVLWFDVWKDDSGEITGDWNKYIFFTDNEQDMIEKAFQEAHNDDAGAYNYADALEVASTVFG